MDQILFWLVHLIAKPRPDLDHTWMDPLRLEYCGSTNAFIPPIFIIRQRMSALFWNSRNLRKRRHRRLGSPKKLSLQATLKRAEVYRLIMQQTLQMGQSPFYHMRRFCSRQKKSSSESLCNIELEETLGILFALFCLRILVSWCKCDSLLLKLCRTGSFSY